MCERKHQNVKDVEWGSDEFIKRMELAQEKQRQREEQERHVQAVMMIQGH